MTLTESYAQSQNAKFSNAARTCREFSSGDSVLFKRNPLKKPPKLEPLWLGPYKVKTSNMTYRLELKTHQCFHPVVYIGLLRTVPILKTTWTTERLKTYFPLPLQTRSFLLPGPCTFLKNLFISFKNPRLFWKKGLPGVMFLFC